MAEVRLLNAQKDYKQSIAVADKAQKDQDAAYKRELDAGGQTALTAKHDGLHENWFILALLKADAYKGLGDWTKAVKELDAYIAENPQAADILIDRGNAKIELKDNAGCRDGLPQGTQVRAGRQGSARRPRQDRSDNR